MSGRAIRFRGVLAASALAACTGVCLQTPAAADTRHYIYEYTCTGGHLLRDDGPKNITVDVTIPTSVRVGERIAVDWTLSDSPLAASAAFKAGGRLIATGTSGVKGLWSGQLDSTGHKDQAVLAKNGPLKLPSAISGSVTTTETGKLTITPGQLVLDFIPPADTIRVNDNGDIDGEPEATVQHKHGPITYNESSWFRAADRSAYKDYKDDLHATAKKDDSVTVTFVGTGLAYIGERVKTVGEFEVSLGTDPKVIATVNAYDPAPEATPKAQEVLWSKTDFPYGEHTVKFKNVAPTGTVMAVDAFDFITRELSTPPDNYFRTTCTTKTVKSATVEVLPAPTPTSTSTSPGGNGHITDGDDSGRGVNVLSGGGQGHGAPTATATATVTRKPTPEPSRTPQVRVTPKGGAQTGEASGDGTAAPLLIGYGTVLTVTGVAGGALRRRRRRTAV
ncbi:hypothetical protein GCM10009677_21220 [Sphaerisporangium rubeum]|uniref:Uncharacterized protein n=1 Tax=Sphaerisporangium rubeum TaxID=321317 RepID=A0A7X0IAR3_9ACTN|nr:hypothetical protein [Sphaerisporangium rubeum]MBB6471772.1 hypothetical protein [Sphaerisporangium rubeum]